MGFAQAKADLTIKIKGPNKAVQGQELGKSIKVRVRNNGKAVAENFSVDLILSKNRHAPIKFATYSPNYSDDVLLKGGREFVKKILPGQTITVVLNGTNKIPSDTPTGKYFLGAVVDPGNKIPETNERNNVAFSPIRIGKLTLARPLKPVKPVGIRPVKLPDLGMYGFLKLGKYKKQVKWGDTIVLTPSDATLISSGKPAFEVYYSHREYAGVAASGFKNKVYFNGNVVSIQSSLSLAPKEIKDIHTQAYLGPQDGKLEIKIDDENNVVESREDNNGPFFVYIKFRKFGPGTSAKRLPDLIVKDIRLVKGCKMQVIIQNIGSAGVPAAGYDMSNGVAIQMYKGASPWGGIRLGAIDPTKKLMTPGNSVSWVWFPNAANLNLTPGTHSIKVVVDNNNAVTESNETNNTRIERLVCR
jgi:subtilase family serine protease